MSWSKTAGLCLPLENQTARRQFLTETVPSAETSPRQFSTRRRPLDDCDLSYAALSESDPACCGRNLGTHGGGLSGAAFTHVVARRREARCMAV